MGLPTSAWMSPAPSESTPAATAMASVAVAFATDVLIKAASDATSDTIKDRLKALFRRKKDAPGTPAPVTFTRDQMVQMRAAAEAEARRFGLSDSDAQAMADAMFRHMVLGDQ